MLRLYVLGFPVRLKTFSFWIETIKLLIYIKDVINSTVEYQSYNIDISNITVDIGRRILNTNYY